MEDDHPNPGTSSIPYLPTVVARFGSALDIASLYLLARHVQILSLHSPSQIHLPSKTKPYIACPCFSDPQATTPGLEEIISLPTSSPVNLNLNHPHPSSTTAGQHHHHHHQNHPPKMRLPLPALLLLLPFATPSDLPTPCGGTTAPDCPAPLTCIPLSTSCTAWPRCPGTCQALDPARQRVYTLCGGWRMMDDCDERVESCVADPRREGECGPACDGPGICHRLGETCRAAVVEGGGEEGVGCPEGTACFFTTDWTGVRRTTGMCFPLRYGSDFYERSRGEEVVRTDQDGYQREG